MSLLRLQVVAWTFGSAMLALTAAAVTEPAIISELAKPESSREGKVAFLKHMCEYNIDETFGNFLCKFLARMAV